MPPIPKGATVAVTGAAGFIGGWCVVKLLDKGYRVRACVRDATDDTKTAFLVNMPAYASGRLTLHSADLNDAGCFDTIFAGCQGVLHVSHLPDYESPEHVQATCDHIVASINNSKSVNRLIFTSSIAGIISEISLSELVKRPVLYEDRYPDESDKRRTHTTMVRALLAPSERSARCTTVMPCGVSPSRQMVVLRGTCTERYGVTTTRATPSPKMPARRFLQRPPPRVASGTASPSAPQTTLAQSRASTRRTRAHGSTTSK